MLDWTLEASQIAQGRKREDLDSDRIFFNAVIRCIEVIGEAASKISLECRYQYPQIPWEDIIGMRNRLIHAYFDIQTDIVWKTVVNELPYLRQELEKIVSMMREKDI
ncbi:MAG: HepT-like ribonuclease domain-containing protein [Candidatus Omnitrophota bacterium]